LSAIIVEKEQYTAEAALITEVLPENVGKKELKRPHVPLSLIYKRLQF